MSFLHLAARANENGEQSSEWQKQINFDTNWIKKEPCESPVNAAEDIKRHDASMVAARNLDKARKDAVLSMTIKKECDDANTEMIRLPPFLRKNPVLWFTQVEAVFDLARITDDEMKFKYIVCNLDAFTISIVADVLRAPPREARYEMLKAKIISTFDVMTEADLRCILQTCAFREDSEKPSHFLGRLRRMATARFTENLLRTLFMEQMPNNVRIILELSELTDLQKLALMADEVCKQIRVKTKLLNAQRNEKERINELTRQIKTLKDNLGQKNAQLKNIKNPQCRNRSRSPRRKEHNDVPAQVPNQIAEQDSRFNHVYLDLMGPLPESYECQYCLIMIDLATAWPEAVGLMDISAETVVFAFFENWIARFGAPEVIITESLSQFRSQSFEALASLLGSKLSCRTDYAPEYVDKIQQKRLSLKASIKCHANDGWYHYLPVILLGLRTCYKDSIKAAPAEKLYGYGKTLKVPAEYFGDMEMSKASYYCNEIRNVRPSLEGDSSGKKAFAHKDLLSCTHVFVKNITGSQFNHSYEGPFKILNRSSNQEFTIDFKGQATNILTKNLKPAYYEIAAHS